MVVFYQNKMTFKGVHRQATGIEYEVFVALARGGTMSNNIKKKWIKKMDGIKIPHRRQNFEKCNSKNFCENCVEKLFLIVFIVTN